MHTQQFFSVNLSDIQSIISFIRHDAHRTSTPNPKIVRAKNAYKGWFSQTQKILTEIEKDEHHTTVFKAIEYRQRLNAHLKKISTEQSVMHDDKRYVLTLIVNHLSTLIHKKLTQIDTILASINKAIESNEHLITTETLNEYYNLKLTIHELLNTYNKKRIWHLNQLKSAIEHLVAFIWKSIFSLLPHQPKQDLMTSTKKLVFILEEKLHDDCSKMLKTIKLILWKNRFDRFYEDLGLNHKELLTLTHANPAKSNRTFVLLGNFLNDLNKIYNKTTDEQERTSYHNHYEKLSKIFQKIIKNNHYYLNNRHEEEQDITCIVEVDSVKSALSPQRLGNEVRHYLNSYEDIHAPSEDLQGVFPDIVRSIKNAKHLICITGWEINLHLNYLKPTLKTQREHEKSTETLGKLLVQKAIDNPQLVIAIKVWAQLFYNKKTFHHDTINYLDRIAKEKGLKNGLKDLPNLQFRAANHSSGLNTHHAKCIIVDDEFEQQHGSSERKLTVYYGGLDLTLDRIDDSRHIFHRTPNTYGWRDVHQRVVGPVVRDITTDFFSSWAHANNSWLRFWNKHTQDRDNFCCVERFWRNLENTDLLNYQEMKHASPLWHSQFIRSTVADQHNKFWVAAKPYENSISKGYIQAIKSAQHSIHLESQYLIGGPGVHPSKDKVQFNPIPECIVKKIIERSKTDEPFHVFISLPMLPNTDSEPGSIDMDSIRAHQWLTMKWMMNEIEKKQGNPGGISYPLIFLLSGMERVLLTLHWLNALILSEMI